MPREPAIPTILSCRDTIQVCQFNCDSRNSQLAIGGRYHTSLGRQLPITLLVKVFCISVLLQSAILPIWGSAIPARPAWHAYTALLTERGNAHATRIDPESARSVQHSTQRLECRSNNRSCSKIYFQQNVQDGFSDFVLKHLKSAIFRANSLQELGLIKIYLEHFVITASRNNFC